MGFLSGAYGKLMAGKLVRDIQRQLTSVNSRVRRVTREIQQKERMYQSMERNAKYQMQAQMQYMLQGAVKANANALMAKEPDAAQQLMMLGQMYGSAMGGGAFNMFNGLGIAGLGNISTGVSAAYSQIQQAVQMQYMQSQTMWQNMFEMQREADLEALHDVEEDLQLEKDSLESQLAIAKEEYQAKKQEEKDGAKNLTPDYTGQGG